MSNKRKCTVCSIEWIVSPGVMELGYICPKCNTKITSAERTQRRRARDMEGKTHGKIL